MLRVSALKRAVQSFPPDFRLILTKPEVRSPYSTEGMPRMISTCSIWSVEMLRMSTPRFCRVCSQVVPCSRVEEVGIGTSSITNNVPNEVILKSSLLSGALAGSRRWIRLAEP